MTLPDVRGCWQCGKSVGKVQSCPHCGAELVLSFDLEWTIGGETTKETLDCPVLTDPPDPVDGADPPGEAPS